ncbi:MAG: hypothetical protein ABSH56_10540 [Bryobacteraceae bacterium]
MSALAICTGTAQAAGPYLSVALGAKPNIACDTTTGPSGSATLTVTLTTSGTAAYKTANIVISPLNLPSALVATPSPASATFAYNGGTGSVSTVTYTVTAAPGCLGTFAAPTKAATAVSYSVPTFNFQLSGGGLGNNVSDAAAYTAGAVTISETTPAASPLTAPSSVTVNCVYSAGNYTTPATTFNLSTAAVGGSTASPTSLPAALVLGASATSYTVPYGGTVQASLQASPTGCSGAIGTQTSAVVKFGTANGLSTATITVNVTIAVVGPSPVNVKTTTCGGAGCGSSASPLSLTYTRYSENLVGASSTLQVLGASGVFFTVNLATMPAWATVSPTQLAITAGGSQTLTFTPTKVADSLMPGTYPAQVAVQVAGYQSTTVYVNLTVVAQAPTLSVQGGNTQNLSWSLGTPLPTPTIMVLSSGTPIEFSTSLVSNNAGASVSPQGGIAYTWGTPIAVTFNPADFAGAQPGSSLTSTVDIGWSLNGAGQTTAVLFSVTINPAPASAATITGITPSSLPQGPGGETFSVTIYGAGFIAGSSNLQTTFVGIVSGGLNKVDANIVASVQNSSTINLTVTIPTATDALLPTTANYAVTLGVCNPGGVAPPCTATSTVTLTINSGPVITTPGGVTSASTFNQVLSPAGNLAPYDIISIFGNNFCISGGTGCTNGQILYPTITAAGTYPTFLTPDASGTQRLVQVLFCANPSSATTTVASCSAAPLLFATNNQINAVVPGGLTVPKLYDIYVRFGAAATTLAANASSAYTFTTSATDPGVFIVDSTNDGAIVLATGINAGQVANVSYPARLRPAPGISDYVEIYMTGLGVPPGTLATNTGSVAPPPANCLTPAEYESVWSSPLTTLDGFVLTLPSTVFGAGETVPCFNPNSVVNNYYLAVSLGNNYVVETVPTNTPQAAGPTYEGWAPGAIAGLYQVDVQLPNITTPAAEATNIYSVPVSSVSTNIIAGTGVNSGVKQVQVNLTPTTGTFTQTVYMYVQPAMAFVDTTNSNVQTTSNIYYSVSGLSYAYTAAGALTGTLGFPTETLAATGSVGGVSYALTADSLGTALSASSITDGIFTVDPSGGTVAIDSSALLALPGFAVGNTYSATITATDTGDMPTAAALPTETITVVLNIVP